MRVKLYYYKITCRNNSKKDFKSMEFAHYSEITDLNSHNPLALYMYVLAN